MWHPHFAQIKFLRLPLTSLCFANKQEVTARGEFGKISVKHIFIPGCIAGTAVIMHQVPSQHQWEYLFCQLFLVGFALFLDVAGCVKANPTDFGTQSILCVRLQNANNHLKGLQTTVTRGATIQWAAAVWRKRPWRCQGSEVRISRLVKTNLPIQKVKPVRSQRTTCTPLGWTCSQPLNSGLLLVASLDLICSDADLQQSGKKHSKSTVRFEQGHTRSSVRIDKNETKQKTLRAAEVTIVEK